MANASQEINYAGKRLVVDSLQVIGELDNGQVKQLTTRVNAMQQMQASFNSQQSNYWSSLAADDRITPLEKKSLLKEWNEIQATYIKLSEEAVNRGIEDNAYFNTYESNYAILDRLLNTNLKLFEDLTSTTNIPDRAAFNKAYSDYYSFENYCQMVLSDQITNKNWEELSSDEYISPIEKKSLKLQIDQITGNYNGYDRQANDKGMKGTRYWQDYSNDYNALYTYLYTTLKLFDDMEKTTHIEDREAFNTYFENYYAQESFMNVALNTGIMGTLGFRVLENLTEAGTEGEVGLYHGTIYQYVVSEGAGMWVPVGAEGYAGVLSDLPVTEIEGQYFLAAENFTRDLPLNVWIDTGNNLEERALEVNGFTVIVKHEFELGYIYLFQQGVWTKLLNQEDYRYLQTMLDYWNITQTLPPLFQQYITEASTAEAERILSNLKQPSYRGVFESAPAIDLIEGDTFLYAGTTYGSWENSMVYIYRSGNWEKLSPTDSTNGQYYMEALYDLLQLNNAGPGYFTALFCTALFANSLFTNKLNTFNLELQNGGKIFSSNYDNSHGFYMDSTGKAVFNEGTFRGAVYADSGTFKGRVEASEGSFKGELQAATGTFKGTLSGADGTFSGSLEAASGSFKGDINFGNNSDGQIKSNNYEEGTTKGLKIWNDANGLGLADITGIRVNELASRVKDSNGYSYILLSANRVMFNGILVQTSLRMIRYPALTSSLSTLYDLINDIMKRTDTYYFNVNGSFTYVNQSSSITVTLCSMRILLEGSELALWCRSFNMESYYLYLSRTGLQLGRINGTAVNYRVTSLDFIY